MQRIISLSFILFTLIYLGACTSAQEKKESTPTQEASAETKPKLPNFQVKTMDGKLISISQLPQNRPTIVFFFHPDCEHCQAEATELQKYTDRFANTNFLMITWDEIPKIQGFMQKYKLKAPITAYKIDNNTLFQTFGVLRLPAVYIYNSQNDLIQQFNGEAKIDAILNYIK
ncbi:TlpA disulfide reductase family protein [Cytophagaceae bacterium DM2B3-1]|uniref:TlpA disulfide reductase family protein n=1 Tax=Xanthocytophaga flava TaxID=3048013 RepID=A0ABT7CF32_9BACT|nr:TlpA disulfide reductase family protein [Xanthocytophaga flavus]MDJ1492333.1 TlpA disulfide reductase family protein [Xanthocytophaga flavus]